MYPKRKSSQSPYINNNFTLRSKLKDKPNFAQSTFMKTSNSISFLKRNYSNTLNQQQEEIKYKGSVISADSLNALYVKLKSYYDFVLEVTKKTQEGIDQLNDDNHSHSMKQEKLIEFKDFDLPNEKISFNDFDNLKLQKEEIEAEVKALNNHKAELKRKYENEVEYSKTIEHMFANEKITFKKLNDNIIRMEDNIETINNYKRHLDQNLNENCKKQRNYTQVLNKVNDNIDLIETVIENQIQKKEDLDESITAKENNLNENRMKVKIEIDLLKEEVTKRKETVINKLTSMNEKKKEKHSRERSYVKTILCLNVIQKYFVQGEEFNVKELLQSRDYYELLNERLLIVDSNGESIFYLADHSGEGKDDSYTRLRKTARESSGSFLSPKETIENHQMAYTTPSGFKMSKITLEDLRHKCDQVTITRQDLFQYYSKIISRITFYRNQFIHLNHKHIQLENQKSVCFGKVKDIISKDYKNFADLLRLNSRFEDFLKRNSLLIDVSKEENERATSRKIEEEFQIDSQGKSNNSAIYRNMKHKRFNAGEGNDEVRNKDTLDYIRLIQLNDIEQKSIELYKEVDQSISEIKNILDYFRSAFNGIKAVEEIKPAIKQAQYLSKTIALSSTKISKFEEYYLKLIDYALSNEDIMSNVNPQLLDIDRLNSIKQLLFQNDNTPNTVFINRLKAKAVISKPSLFKLMKKRKQIVAVLSSIAKLALESSYQEHPQASLLNRRCTKKEIAKQAPISLKHPTSLKFKFKPPVRQEVLPDDSYSDRETAQTDNRNSRHQKSSLDERIILKLYKPTLEKTSYSRNLNNNMKLIRSLTSNHCKANFALKKKTMELEELSNNLLIYNNPKININKLTNSTYNEVIKYVVSSQVTLERKNMKIGN